jgi:hypothetical protein
MIALLSDAHAFIPASFIGSLPGARKIAFTAKRSM